MMDFVHPVTKQIRYCQQVIGSPQGGVPIYLQFDLYMDLRELIVILVNYLTIFYRLLVKFSINKIDKNNLSYVECFKYYFCIGR